MSQQNDVIQLQCPGCGKKLNAKQEHVGMRMKCPECETIITVQTQAAAPQPSIMPAAPQSAAPQAAGPVNPYQAPVSMDNTSSPAMQGHVQYPFESGNGRASIAMMLVGCCMVISAIVAFLRFSRVAACNRRDLSAIESADQIVMVVVIGSLVVSLISAITFLMWMHRAYRNLPALGAHNLRMTPGWSVGYWFIPIINLYRPFQAMTDIWKGSDPNGAVPNRPANPPSLVNLWWSLWIIILLVSNFGSVTFNNARNLNDAMRGDTILAWAEIGSIIMGVVTIAMVSKIDKNQTKRNKILSEEEAA